MGENATPQLEHNYLSNNCGLKVSALGLGTMTFGGTHVSFVLSADPDTCATPGGEGSGLGVGAGRGALKSLCYSPPQFRSMTFGGRQVNQEFDPGARAGSLGSEGTGGRGWVQGWGQEGRRTPGARDW